MGSALKTMQAIENPEVPVRMMDRYSGRTTALKLGIGEDSKVALVEPPPECRRIFDSDIQFEEDPAWATVILCFVQHVDSLSAAIDLGRRYATTSKFWICWKKGKKSPIGERYIRESAIAFGLVDYKVCSLDSVWSGLLFASGRKSKRAAKEL